MSILRIALLGSFQVTRDEQPVTAFESDKVRALLAYLAVEANRPHRRETLAALLWPDMPESTARSNLRHALANLRQAIHDDCADPPYLHITRQTIQFNQASQHELDTAVFSPPPHTNQQRETMAALYRGDFLAGFSIAGSTAFDEWTAVKREQVHRQMRQALHELADTYAQQGQYEPALSFARRQVAMEPWDEAAHQQLIRLLALTGQRSAALAQYEDCCHILEEELGIAPTGITTTLIQNIRDETWPDDAARLPLPRFVVEETNSSPPPLLFVAREPELARLNQFLNQARTGQHQIAFITGEPGSGKTALLQAFARQAMAAHPDLLVADGKCSAYTGSGDPYLPFREIIQMLTGDMESRWEAGDVSTDHARRLWSALPEVTGALVGNGRLLLNRFISGADLLPRAQVRTRHQSPDQVPWLAQLAEWVQTEEAAVPVSPTDLFVQFASLLETAARQHPLLLLLDDLQWIDSGSLNLLFHLGQHLRGSRILILGAYRPGDVALGRDGHPHPLTGLVNEFQQQLGPNQVDLSDAGGRPFIDALLDSQPNRLNETFRRELHRQTGGQALFTIELLRGLQERGDLVQDAAGYWVESGHLDWNITPARIEAAIAVRINRLPPNCRTTLTIASVEGEAFTAEVVAHIQKSEEQEIVRCLSGDLSRQHRLVTAQSRQRLGQQPLSRYRFHHFLFQKYLYNDLDTVERASLHEAVGETLEKLYGPQETVLATMFGQLAWHYQEAGVTQKAVAYCQKAGERAWQLSASEEAITHLRQGLALLEKLPESPEWKQQELALHMGLAMPLQATKGFAAPEVQQTYDRAYLLCQQVGQTSQLFAVLGFLGSYYLTSGQYHKSFEMARQIFELGQQFQDPLQIALGRLGLGANFLELGEFIQSWEHLEKFVAFYDFRQHHAQTPHYGLDPGINALLWAAWVTWILGYPDQSTQHSQATIYWAKILDHPFSLATAWNQAVVTLHTTRREYQAVAKGIEVTLQLAIEQKFFFLEISSLFYQGFLRLLNGETEEGIEQMKRARDGYLSTGLRMMYTDMLGLLAEALGQIGQIEEALQTLDEALTIVKHRDERWFEANLHRIKGDLLQKSGAEASVIEAAYQQAITIAQRQAAKSWELRATLSLARLWQRQGKIGEAYCALSEIYTWFTEGFDTPDLQDARLLLKALSEKQR